jgi:hypothetical protein
MTPQNLFRLTATAAVVTGLGVATAGAVAPAGTTQELTKEGVGQLELGMTYKEAHAMGLIRRIRRGCELGGPDTRSARLKPPLKGEVNFGRNKPRRIRDITIRAGAEARGVGIGDTIPDIKDAFPKAKVNHGTDEVFGVTLVRVGRKGGGPIRFAVDVDSKKITLMGVPHIAFCE